MTKSNPKPTTPKMDSDARTVIDLNGAEQHHDLKNKSGDAGADNHAEKPVSERAKKLVRDAAGQAEDSAVGDALRKAVK